MTRQPGSAYGIKLPSGQDKSLRILRQKVRPLEHGHKIWGSSWLLMDYLQHHPLWPGSRVLDLGCGWGLAGIFCAKTFDSFVTWADIDPAVSPYLNLRAQANGLTADFVNSGIEQIRRPLLHRIDVIVASDICFCDSLIDPLRRLVHRARAASVQHIFIADPGRWPFEDLAECFDNKNGATLISWKSTLTADLQGKILHIDMSNCTMAQA